MRILISHCTYPSQFRRLAPALSNQGHEVVFLHEGHEWHAEKIDGVNLVRYISARSGDPSACHPYLRKLESAVCQGQACYRAAKSLLQQGFYPDLIISHAGFGGGLYLGDAFPKAKRISLFEWYYNGYGSDVEFLNKGNVSEDQLLRLRTWNAQLLLELADCDHGVVPTEWQKSQFPRKLQGQMSVIHEGVDVEVLGQVKRQDMVQNPWLPNDPNTKIITYVSRGFEAYRGFPQAMHAIAQVQRQHPEAVACIAGNDVVCYGANRTDGRTWKEWAIQECDLDLERTHWLGALNTRDYQTLLAVSDVHLYLTIPFVLSWSLIEAMAAGCAIVSSRTAPVEEVICDGQEGLLADFWQPKAISEQITRLLNDPTLSAHVRRCAKQRAQAYGAQKGLQQWCELIQAIS